MHSLLLHCLGIVEAEKDGGEGKLLDTAKVVDGILSGKMEIAEMPDPKYGF